jgi:Zn-dependent protease with chaperone function
LRCQRCGLENPEELGFCSNCGYRLAPNTGFDLTLDDYLYEPDRSAIEMIKATGVLPYLVKNLALPNLEKNVLSKLSHATQRATSPSKVDALVRHCANILSLDTLPEVLITESAQPNAFTFGREDHASIVLTSGILNLLTEGELSALFAHELTHVKSGHMLYHTVAEILGGSISASASFLGLNIITVPVRLALLSWHRESEVTADRGSLLVVDDMNIMKSLMTKLAAWTPSGVFSPKQLDIGREKAGMLESASELFSTHPLYVNRFRRLKEFSESEQFLRARRKIKTRLNLLRALIPVCRFCGARKAVEDLFCPACERCQT